MSEGLRAVRAGTEKKRKGVLGRPKQKDRSHVRRDGHVWQIWWTHEEWAKLLTAMRREGKRDVAEFIRGRVFAS